MFLSALLQPAPIGTHLPLALTACLSMFIAAFSAGHVVSPGSVRTLISSSVEVAALLATAALAIVQMFCGFRWTLAAPVAIVVGVRLAVAVQAGIFDGVVALGATYAVLLALAEAGRRNAARSDEAVGGWRAAVSRVEQLLSVAALAIVGQFLIAAVVRAL